MWRLGLIYCTSLSGGNYEAGQVPPLLSAKPQPLWLLFEWPLLGAHGPSNRREKKKNNKGSRARAGLELPARSVGEKTESEFLGKGENLRRRHLKCGRSAFSAAPAIQRAGTTWRLPGARTQNGDSGLLPLPFPPPPGSSAPFLIPRLAPSLPRAARAPLTPGDRDATPQYLLGSRRASASARWSRPRKGWWPGWRT